MKVRNAMGHQVLLMIRGQTWLVDPGGVVDVPDDLDRAELQRCGWEIVPDKPAKEAK